MTISYHPFELHTHTLHSDGVFTPEELVNKAKECGLAGIAITDHNTATAYQEGLKVGTSKNLVVLKGIELTTFYGHLTVLGKDKINWREFSPSTIREKAKEITKKGGCIGISHPYRIGYPICSGCNDEWGVKDYNIFTHYEVWSGMSPSTNKTNEMAENKYYQLCQQGNKLACVYGRDWHREEKGDYALTFIGIEGKVNANSAIDAIKKRRTYISCNIKMDATLTEDNPLEQVKKTHHIGEVVPKGRYKLDIYLDLFDKDYQKKHKVDMEKVILQGSAIEETIIVDIDKKEINLCLGEGFLQIVVMGKLNGMAQKLLIATPFYVE